MIGGEQATGLGAAVVLGERASGRLRRAGLPARLVRVDGTVERVCGWPEDLGGAR